MKKISNFCKMAFILAVVMALILAGCSSPKQETTVIPESSQKESERAVEAGVVAACASKECFTSLANGCKEGSVTLTEAAGIIKYESSADCTFTKTLVSLDESETSEMKLLLNGKSLACKYEAGSFNQMWANSLIFGLENCNGELRNILGELLAFG